MAGECKFALSGTVFYVKDSPASGRKSWCSLSVGFELPEQFIGTKRISAHGIFATISYDPKDQNNSRFQNLKKALVKGAHIFLRGDLKPKAASADGKYPATINVATNWRNIKVSENPFATINEVFFSGEVMGVAQPSLKVLYSYVNPLEKDPKKKWKEREFSFVTHPQNLTGRYTREPIHLRGRFFGISPKDLKTKLAWLYADTVF